MSLASGTRLGIYEIVGTLGAGGMGEVYRARDPRLQRDVAIKILPGIFATDAERLARFAREAQVLASLNHPHIAHVYGFEGGSTSADPPRLVMELVDGPTLADRIARGPMSVDDAVPIARQIGDALEAAHQRGIIHRDLKPANIKLTGDGSVKVLDFGLAKALAEPDDSRAGSAAASPTITTPAMTGVGVVLGTAAYMSPEQARGRAVDKRCDIWAFGVVLYELVTGRRPFEGDTVSDTLASVLKTEPDWAPVPVPLQRLLKSCLQKDPSRRLRDIGDAWCLVDDTPALLPVRSRTQWLAWAVAAVFVVATSALATVHFREQPPVALPLRFQIPPPDKSTYDIYLVLSPDGRRLAFTARDANGLSRIWVRDLDRLESRPVPGTEDAWGPFWSPDSRFLGFAVNRQLKKIDPSGGAAQTLCDVSFTVGTGAWTRDGVILFGSRGGAGAGLHRVSAAGGEASPVTALDPARQEGLHALPTFLPDARHFIYLRTSPLPEYQGLYVGSLDRAPAEQQTTRLLSSLYAGAFAPDGAGGGHLLFLRDATLLAQPFDLGTLSLTGETVPVAEQVGRSGSFGFFSVSGDRVLVYRTGDATAPATGILTWFDRSGKRLSTVGQSGPTAGFALSPNESKVAIVRGPSVLGDADIWLLEFARGVFSRFTFTPSREDFPVWSPDGSRLVFRSSRSGNFDLFEKASSGAGDERRLRESIESERPTDWSSDGRLLFYDAVTAARSDMGVLPLDGGSTPIALHQTEFNETQPRLSPDGRWLAYTSDESGRNEIYVRPFAPPGTTPGAPAGKWQISRDGGANARWRRDGRELFFRAPDATLMAVAVRTGTVFEAAETKSLFTMPSNAANWDVTADGKRFLVAVPVLEQGSTPVTVVLNWQAALRP